MLCKMLNVYQDKLKIEGKSTGNLANEQDSSTWGFSAITILSTLYIEVLTVCISSRSRNRAQFNYIWPGEIELTGLEEWSTALPLNRLPSTCRGTCCPWKFYRVWKHKSGRYLNQLSNAKISDEYLVGEMQWKIRRADTYSCKMTADTNLGTVHLNSKSYLYECFGM